MISRRSTPAHEKYRVMFEPRWKSEYLKHQYARAREIQGHVAADMAVEAATTAEDPRLGRRVLRRTEVAVTGANGGPVQSVTVSVTDPIEAARVCQKLMGEDAGARAGWHPGRRAMPGSGADFIDNEPF
jgi:hypothetical protein